MRRLLGWRREQDGFDARVRANRPQLRPEFLERLVLRAERHPPPAAAARVRGALVAGLTVLLLAALAGAGGLGYAVSVASAAKQAMQDAANSDNGTETVENSPGEQQYFGARCGQEPPKKPADPDKRARCPVQAGKNKTTESNPSSSGTATAPASGNDLTIASGDDLTIALIPVFLTAWPETTVTVKYSTSNGTALAGLDYVATDGILTFLPGEMTKTVPVVVLPDILPEGPEVLYLDLSEPSENAFIEVTPGVAEIEDND
jgi:hypothetical protein